MQTSSNNLWLFKNHFLKGRKNFKNLEKKKFDFFFFFVRTQSLAQIFKRLLLPRNNECSAQHTKVTIRNWVTFCGINQISIFYDDMRLENEKDKEDDKQI